ncbi:hypothetical protein ASG93_27405 [Paenibacillus sp. Soil787]|nr:hypothetical protein ASG93_27405 [Paenibacillus sp. Soil787]
MVYPRLYEMIAQGLFVAERLRHLPCPQNYWNSAERFEVCKADRWTHNRRKKMNDHLLSLFRYTRKNLNESGVCLNNSKVTQIESVSKK